MGVHGQGAGARSRLACNRGGSAGSRPILRARRPCPSIRRAVRSGGLFCVLGIGVAAHAGPPSVTEVAMDWRVAAPAACGSSRCAALRVAARVWWATTTRRRNQHAPHRCERTAHGGDQRGARTTGRRRPTARCLRHFLHDANPAYTPQEIERYVEAWSQPGAAAGMINYYRASVRQSQKEAVAKLHPLRRRHWSSGGIAIPTSAPSSPSPTPTTCPTSTASSASPTRRTGSITTKLNGSTSCSSSSSPEKGCRHGPLRRA